MRLVIFGIFIFLFFIPLSLEACNSPVFLRFHEDAQDPFDSLNQNPTDDNKIHRIIYGHNLAFHKNHELRELVEELIKGIKKEERTPLIEAYDGSLRMIRVSHRNMASKIVWSIFGKSPYDEAREGFNMISQALAKSPDNINIRFLRASAAVEAAEHLPELLFYAEEDILWLEKNIDHNDPALVFFLNLTWAKFYYKSAHSEKLSDIRAIMIDKAIEYVNIAGDNVCNEVYCREHKTWEEKITSFQIK